MQNVDLEGLSEEQRSLVARFVGLLREAGHQPDAREEFDRLWAEWSKRAPDLNAAEAAQLIEEAVAHARSHV